MKTFKITGNKEELKKLKNITNDTEISVKLSFNFYIEFIQEFISLLIQKNIISMKILENSSHFYLKIDQLLKMKTIKNLYLDLDYTKIEKFPKLKESIQIPNLKNLTLITKSEEVKLSTILSYSFNELEVIELEGFKIDDYFNQILFNSNLKSISFIDCSFIKSFEFKLNFKKLEEIVFNNCTNYPFKSLYEMIKDNSERISFDLIENKDDWKKDEIKDFVNLLNHVKFLNFNLVIEESLLEPILTQNFCIDLKNIFISFKLMNNLILSKFISKLYHPESINIQEACVTKETLQNLKDKKSLKILKILDNTNFTSKELFDLLNDSNIENLTIHNKKYQKSKEFFNLMKENRNIKELDIYFWDESIFNMISNNDTLENLKICFNERKEEEITEFFNSLKKNKSIKYLCISKCKSFNSMNEYFSTNPKIKELTLYTENNNDVSLLKVLHFNTNLKSLKFDISREFEKRVDKINKNDVEIIKRELEDLFQYNYTLIVFKFKELNLDYLEFYYKRNKEISKIYKVINGEDLFFNFY